MARAFIVYETRYGSTEDAVRKMALILGPARFCRTAEFRPDYIEKYDFWVIGGGVYNEYIDHRITDFVAANKSWLSKKKVALFATCLSDIRGIHYLEPLKHILGDCVVASTVVDGRFRKDQLNEEDYDILEGFYASIKRPFIDTDRTNTPKLVEWCLKLKALKDRDDKALPPEQLKPLVEEFLASYNVCVLCSAAGAGVRGSPVTYKYHDGHLYIVTEGGTKMANLLTNNQVSVSIYEDSSSGRYRRAGMQMTGELTIVRPGEDGYKRIMEIMGLNHDRMVSLPWLMNALDVRLSKAEFRWREFDEAMGAARVQVYQFR